MSYKPVPGTTPYRVIELLGASEELSTAQIAAELDVPAGQIHAFMKTALANGAVVTERRGNCGYWKLGDGTPPPAITEPDDEPVVQRVVPAAEAPPPRPTLADLHGIAAGNLAGRTSEGIVEASREEWVEPTAPAPGTAAEPGPPEIPAEEQLAAEVLERIGFPVPEGKYTICRNTCLYIRGGRGAGSFVFRYVAPSGQRREMGLGSFIANSRPHALAAIAEAMRQAEQQQALLLSGLDPLDEAGPGRPSRSVAVAAPAAELVPTPAAPMRCAVWSDGALSIERAGQRLEFSTEETRALCSYLDKVLAGGREA